MSEKSRLLLFYILKHPYPKTVFGVWGCLLKLATHQTTFLVTAAIAATNGIEDRHKKHQSLNNLTLWGRLAHVPELTVLVPSTPADAGGLVLAALRHDGPVIFLEHKLLSEAYLTFLGSGGRRTVRFDVPAEGTRAVVPPHWEPVPIGKAAIRRSGSDVTITSVGVGVHRALEAARELENEGISVGVLDLRTVSPLDKVAVGEAVAKTGRLLVVDEDYEGFGLSGELAAVVLEAGISFKYARVCTQATIPYARHLEDQILANKECISAGVRGLMK